MKNSFKFMIGFLAILVSTILVACDTTIPASLAQEDIYNFSVLTGSQLNMINEDSISQSALFTESTNEDDLLPVEDTTPIAPTNDLENLNHYTNLFETFLSDPIMVSNPEPSDLLDEFGTPLYQFKITYEVKNAIGETVIYVLHYTEVNYVVYTDISRKSLDYIKMSNELDDYGQYFKYETYQSGELQDILIMKIEINKDEDIELEIELENKISDLHFKLKLRKDANSGSLNGVYEIKDDEDEEHGEIKITVSKNPFANLNEYRYNYKNEHTKNGFEKGKRNHRQNDDDEDTSFIFTV